jgi:PAS domain S-box-containing protein
MRKFWEFSQDILWLVDIKNCFLDVSPPFERALGYTKHAVLGRPFSDFLHPDDLAATFDSMKMHPAVHIPYHFENRYRCKDGSYKWLSWSSVRSEGEKLIYSIARDITWLKQAKETLLQSENRMRRIFEAVKLGILFWELNGDVTDANDRFLEIVGYSREDLQQGQIDWINMTPPEYMDVDKRAIEEVRVAGVNSVPVEKEYIRKDGPRTGYNFGALLDETRLTGVAFVLDITERKKVRMPLKKAKRNTADCGNSRRRYLAY